jgi:hypothetical protein
LIDLSLSSFFNIFLNIFLNFIVNQLKVIGKI